MAIKIPTWKTLFTKPSTLKLAMNLWPPFLFSGVKITFIDEKFERIDVALRDYVLNRNYVGTHFGGSLFSMLDPFFMLMTIQRLGDHYYVWDKAGEIDFKAPGKGRLTACLRIEPIEIEQMKDKTKTGDKYEPVLEAEILDSDSTVVAVVRKRLYVRLKPKYRPQLASERNEK